MFLPILRYDDGYGFTYGVRTSFVDRLGPRSRISVPLSWGGERQARVQVERTFKLGPVDRVAGEFGIGRKENPHYEIGDTRTSFNARVEGAVQRWLRYGVGGGVDDVEFGEVQDRLETFGADATIDTRVDPAFPRNAVHAKFGWERLQFDAGQANRNTVDAARLSRPVRRHGAGAARAVDHVGSAAAGLRAQPAGRRRRACAASTPAIKADDNIAAASAELRIPLTSPLSIGRFGVKIFADYGAAYPNGQKLADQTFDLGIGGGAYLHLTLISLGLDVAKGRGGDWHFQFGMGVTFK